MNKQQIISHVDEIAKISAEFYDIDPDKMHENTRLREVVAARQMTWHIARKIHGAAISTSSLGQHFAGRDHATVLHSIKTVNDQLDIDPRFKMQYEQIYRNAVRAVKRYHRQKPDPTLFEQLMEVLEYKNKIHMKIRIRELIKNMQVSL